MGVEGAVALDARLAFVDGVDDLVKVGDLALEEGFRDPLHQRHARKGLRAALGPVVEPAATKRDLVHTAHEQRGHVCGTCKSP